MLLDGGEKFGPRREVAGVGLDLLAQGVVICHCASRESGETRLPSVYTHTR